jgi:hypothetical protein
VSSGAWEVGALAWSVRVGHDHRLPTGDDDATGPDRRATDRPIPQAVDRRDMADTSPTGAVRAEPGSDGDADAGVDADAEDGPTLADRLALVESLVWAGFALFVAVLVGGVVASPFFLGGATPADVGTDALVFFALVGAAAAGTVLLVAAQVAFE